jgi:hypothetical protein
MVELCRLNLDILPRKLLQRQEYRSDVFCLNLLVEALNAKTLFMGMHGI